MRVHLAMVVRSRQMALRTAALEVGQSPQIVLSEAARPEGAESLSAHGNFTPTRTL